MKSQRLALVLAGCVFLAFTVYSFLPVLRCVQGCFVDFDALHGHGMALFEDVDTRLNTWILAWVQHSLTSQPFELFRTNAFYPAPNALTGSEHMIGIALLTLPIKLLTSNAVLVYQFTMILSFLILGLTTFALVRWLTGSVWVAIVAGAIALFMPWRTHELAHLQLLGAHWFPLIWLLTFRILLKNGKPRDGVLLSAVLSLQLLSSYYLAYFITFSIAFLSLLILLQTGLERRLLCRLGLSLAVPYALLVLTSIPYLGRLWRGELFLAPDPLSLVAFERLSRAWSFVAPRFETIWSPAPTAGYQYAVPFVVGVLALIVLGRSLVPSRSSSQLAHRQRVVVISLWACVLGAFVMMLGTRITLGDFVVKLPSYWVSQVIPGFSNLRAPHRWGLVPGIAFPVLAALGLSAIDQGLAEKRIFRRGFALRPITRASLVGLLLINVPWRQLPARDAWRDPSRVTAAYDALRALPFAPVVEIPWPTERFRYINLDTQYMLASTWHWRPILNGVTAYLPPTFKFLRRIAQGLPEEGAVEKLSRLTDVRWMIVHFDKLREVERAAWRNAHQRGRLRRVYSDEHTQIFGLPRHQETGLWMTKLVSTAARSETLTGLPRTPLVLSPESGRLGVGQVEGLGHRSAHRQASSLRLEVTNSSDVSWPGFDYQNEGLVELRYVFSEVDGRIVKSDSLPLDADIPAQGTIILHPLIRPPTRRGHYRLSFDLVQRIEGTLVPLPILPVELSYAVPGGLR